MASHYAVTSTIRYYKPSQNIDLVPGSPPRLRVAFVETSGEAPFDFSRWKDAPHVALANLRDEPEAVLRFARTYGVLARGYKGESIAVPVREVLAYRDELRDMWEGKTYSSLLTDVDAQTTVLMGPLIATLGGERGSPKKAGG